MVCPNSSFVRVISVVVAPHKTVGVLCFALLIVIVIFPPLLMPPEVRRLRAEQYKGPRRAPSTSQAATRAGTSDAVPSLQPVALLPRRWWLRALVLMLFTVVMLRYVVPFIVFSVDLSAQRTIASAAEDLVAQLGPSSTTG